MSIVNETGSTFNFYGISALVATIQCEGFASSTDIADVVVNVTSLTIE